MKCNTFLISSICIYLFILFLLSTFFHITTSTVFVFICFQHSLFPYFEFSVIARYPLFQIVWRSKALPSDILVIKNIFPTVKSALLLKDRELWPLGTRMLAGVIGVIKAMQTREKQNWSRKWSYKVDWIVLGSQNSSFFRLGSWLCP